MKASSSPLVWRPSIGRFVDALRPALADGSRSPRVHLACGDRHSADAMASSMRRLTTPAPMRGVSSQTLWANLRAGAADPAY